MGIDVPVGLVYPTGCLRLHGPVGLGGWVTTHWSVLVDDDLLLGHEVFDDLLVGQNLCGNTVDHGGDDSDGFGLGGLGGALSHDGIQITLCVMIGQRVF